MYPERFAVKIRDRAFAYDELNKGVNSRGYLSGDSTDVSAPRAGLDRYYVPPSSIFLIVSASSVNNYSSIFNKPKAASQTYGFLQFAFERYTV